MAGQADDAVAAVPIPAVHLEQAIDESVFAWFWRCMCAVGNGVDLARRHARGEYPYLQLYGTVNNSMFTPHAVMRYSLSSWA